MRHCACLLLLIMVTGRPHQMINAQRHVRLKRNVDELDRARRELHAGAAAAAATGGVRVHTVVGEGECSVGASAT